MTAGVVTAPVIAMTCNEGWAESLWLRAMMLERVQHCTTCHDLTEHNFWLKYCTGCQMQSSINSGQLQTWGAHMTMQLAVN
jgi:hypothetical protein